MCKLQVIIKENSVVKSDTILESAELRKININNIPYFLTIESLQTNKLVYKLTYTDCPDRLEIDKESLSIEYGHQTGRLYSLVYSMDDDDDNANEKRIGNRQWEEFKRMIDILPGLSVSVKSELRTFIKILQDLPPQYHSI